MSIYGTMRTSISGMSAQADRLSTIGDNVANVSTTGYKRVSTEFSTLVLQAVGTNYESGAVETSIRRSVSAQGTFTYSNAVTDLAINGQGFFVVQGPASEILLTRAGAFTPDGNGELVNSAGARLMGYNLANWAGGVVVNGTAGLEPVRLSQLALTAIPSDEGSLLANLPADAAVVPAADLPSANAATASYSARTSLVSYDSLGREVTLDFYFSKSAPETWDVAVFDRATAASGGPFPYTAAPLSTTTLAFSATTGRLTGASPTSISVPVPGGATVDIDMTEMTQFAGDFTVVNGEVNGTAAVPVSKFEMSNDGILTAVYGNGSRIPIFQIPLARVNSPDNLAAVSGNTFLPSLTSGDLQLGLANDAGFGSVISGALEQSTVDIAGEMTAMIEAQRNYTANSRVFQTGADLAEVAVNLRG